MITHRWSIPSATGGARLRAAALAVLTLVSLGLVLSSPASPAWACSCASELRDEQVDLIVVGTVLTVTDSAVQILVDEFEKGGTGLGHIVQLTVGRSEVSCGYDFRERLQYRVRAVGGATGLCTGIRQLSSQPIAVLEDLASDPAEPHAAQPADPETSRRRVLIGAALAVLVIALAAVILRRRRSVTATPHEHA